MVTAAGHDWRLVAPWYRWEREDGQEPERSFHAHGPVLHKYATTDFVDDFLEDPQVSTVFEDGLDYVSNPDAASAGVAKLFQPAHSRFYLVAIGLHCSQPGFPSVDPTRVAEAGFVVRRISREDDAVGAPLARRRIQTVAGRRRLVGRDVMRRLHPFRTVEAGRVLDRGRAASSASARAITADRLLGVVNAKADAKATPTGEQGWVPTGEGTMGAWLPMPERPAEVAETAYPMQPLRPDPDDPDHAGRDGTIFFGLVPTGGDQVTTGGKNRFAADDEYVIRAFVRVDQGDCPGRLIWSNLSQPYSVAAFFDPVGSAQRPVEITMPDLPALRDSLALPSVRMSSPAGSSLLFKGGNDVPGNPGVVGGEQVCFHSIPLITIVATFVLNIFMPVVIWIFQLWWMLRLKFCFPRPAGVAAVNTRLAPFGGIQGAVDVDLEDPLLAGLDKALLEAELLAYFGGLFNDPADIVNANDLNQLVAIMAAQGHGLPNDGRPTYASGLTYTARVERKDMKEPWPP